jgi:hypothetical protein
MNLGKNSVTNIYNINSITQGEVLVYDPANRFYYLIIYLLNLTPKRV